MIKRPDKDKLFYIKHLYKFCEIKREKQKNAFLINFFTEMFGSINICTTFALAKEK